MMDGKLAILMWKINGTDTALKNYFIYNYAVMKSVIVNVLDFATL